MTVDELYEKYMDDKTPFAEDIFEFFGKTELGGYDKEAWAKQYRSYLPTWDPSQVNLALRQRDLDYSNAMDTLNVTRDATERVYDTELDTLSTSLGKELSKSKEIAGGINLRSGDLSSAIQDTIVTTGSKAEDFGDRMRITTEDTKNKYNSAMVDSALDFEKTERQEKEEFYRRTMAAITRLMDTGALEGPDIVDGIEEPTPLEEDFNEFSEGYQECAAYCEGDDDCMYDCAAAAGEGTIFFDEFFHEDDEVLEDLSDLSGIDDDEFVGLTETIIDNPIVNAACCANAWATSYFGCLSWSTKRTADCQKRKQAEACGSC